MQQDNRRWIYFYGMLVDDIVEYKVGTTINPRSRFMQIQVNCPRNLYAFAIYPGGFALEARIHWRLEECRTRGEWFAMSIAKMVAHLDGIKGRLSLGREQFDDLPWCDLNVVASRS